MFGLPAVRVRDCGNASPRFMRMTLNYVPDSKELQKTSQMPFAVIIQPMALLRAGEYPIQVPSGSSILLLACGTSSMGTCPPACLTTMGCWPQNRGTLRIWNTSKM